MTRLAGSKVLITGAGSGIGRLIASKTADRGAHTILWDIDAAALETLAEDLRQYGQPCSVHVCDVSDREAVRATAERVLRESGSIDILVNNAGVVSGKPLLELSDDAIEKTFAINTLALFWTTRAFLPAMIGQEQGHIVTIASAAGIAGTARLTDYCASKHAAVGFDEALRAELRHLGHPIRTTVVCPYYIATGMFEGVRSKSILLPILDPEPAAERIVRAIEKDRARLFMPWTVPFGYLFRLFPTSVFDAVMRWLGISHSMDRFTGRAPGA